MGEDSKEKGSTTEPAAEDRLGSSSSRAEENSDLKGCVVYPSVSDGRDCSSLAAQLQQLRCEKKQMEAALQAEVCMRREAEKLHSQAAQEEAAAKSALQDTHSVTRNWEGDRAAVLKQLSDEKEARLKLEAEAKRLIANIKNEDGGHLPGLTGNELCVELEQLQEFTHRLRLGMQDEHKRLEKAEGSLEELLNEVALMDKNRLSLEAELKELRRRLRSQAEFKSQLDALRENARREVDLVTRRSREEIDEECRQRMKAEGALDEMLKEITENEMARRKAENASREAIHALEAEKALRKKAEEDRMKLEGIAREHHRCRSQAEVANSQLSTDVDALRKDCDHLKQMLKEEKQQREMADSAWKETARRLHGERAMHAYWVKKHKAFLEKGRNEIKEMSQKDLDGGWMDNGLNDGGIRKDSPRGPYPEAPESDEALRTRMAFGGLGVYSLNLPSAAENDWDANRRNSVTPAGVLHSRTMSLGDVKGSNLWCRQRCVEVKGLSAMSDLKSSSVGGLEAWNAHKYKNTVGGPASEEFIGAPPAKCKAPINGQTWEGGEPSGRPNWLCQLSPLRPVKWIFNRRRDAVYHAGKVLQNFWTWVILVGVLAGTIGLGEGGDEDDVRKRKDQVTMSKHFYNPSRGARSWGNGYDADSFMG